MAMDNLGAAPDPLDHTNTHISILRMPSFNDGKWSDNYVDLPFDCVKFKEHCMECWSNSNNSNSNSTDQYYKILEEYHCSSIQINTYVLSFLSSICVVEVVTPTIIVSVHSRIVLLFTVCTGAWQSFFVVILPITLNIIRLGVIICLPNCDHGERGSG